MRPSQNIIQASTFNFEYESKASASRGNELIESIFNTQILPELEKAISNKIPEGILIELSKLEINIGNINEKDLATSLAGRIRTSLENALNFKLEVKSGSGAGNATFGNQNSANFLIESLEIFFLKGYFPFALDESFTIDELVTRAIYENKNDLTKVIKRHRNHDQVIRRIAYNMKDQSVDQTLEALDPVNSKWIIEFRKILLHLKKEMNLNQYSDAEFIQMMNYSILKYVLNETSATFSKKKFSGVILNEFIAIFNPELPDLMGSVKNYTGNTTTTNLINETLAKLNEEKIEVAAEGKEQGLNIDYLIKMLNSGSINFNVLSRSFLMNEIILSIRDKEKNEILTEQLNETGVRLILGLFDRENGNVLLELITSFTDNIIISNKKVVSHGETFSVPKFVLFTVLYLHENAIRTFHQEEYILLLVYAAGLDASKTIKSDAFKQFIQAQKNISLDKISLVIEQEKSYPEISGIRKLLSNSMEQPKNDEDEIKSNTAIAEDYIVISKKKIIGYYLDSGQLPPAWSELNWQDVQLIFRNSIQQKDDLPAIKIRNNEDPRSFIARLNRLTDSKSADELNDYFIHFFQDEFAILSKILAEVKQHFTFRGSTHIQSTEFINEIFVRALAESKGGNLPGVFVFFVLESVNDDLTKDFPGSEDLFNFFTSKSGETKEIGTLSAQTESKVQVKKALEQDFSLLVNKFHLTEFKSLSPDIEVQKLITKIAFYFQADQTVFLDVIQENRKYLLQVYTLFRFYLPRIQWTQIENSLLTRTELKREIEKFQQHADVVLNYISEPELDLADTFENLSKSDPEKLKSFLVLIMNDEILLERLILDTKEIQIPALVALGNPKTQTCLNQLISFYPENLSGKISKKYWKSVVLSFGLRVFIEDKKFNSLTFARAFRNHLILKLKAINEADLFYRITEQMKSSNSNALKELVDLWLDSKAHQSSDDEDLKTNKNSTPEAETEKQNLQKDLRYYISALTFYANNGFFPWWTGQLSFPELISGLNTICFRQSQAFDEAFLQSEKEEQIFTRLIRRIPEDVFPEFDQIISSRVVLAELWRTAMRENVKRNSQFQEKKELSSSKAEPTNPDQFVKNALKDSDLLNKGLYFLDDKEILNNWLKERPQIAVQIKEYLVLAPWFYFRNITPAQWRKAVYEFSLNYYQDNLKPVNKQFHTDFLRHLKIRQSRVNWDKILATVYQLVKSDKTNGQVTFPGALVRLLNIEPPPHPGKNIAANQSNKLHQTDENGIEVKVYNSGLILFWPFLNRLFEYLNLVKNSAFINPESMNRAVYILQYLVFNEIDFPEYNLVLNKLLVGMTSENHLEPFITLTDDEKDKVHSLLYGLINNWEKVKNSSPEGIQQTFLQREGMLRFSADKVSLVVNKKGVDVLLSSIPWNISLVKLAWMKRPIFVEWK